MGLIPELSKLWETATAAMLQHVVEPALTATGLAGVVADKSGLAECLLVGLAQIFVIGVLMFPLEKCWPAERWQDRKFARVDIFHTLINLLGIVPFGTYLVLLPLGDAITRLLGQDPASESWHLGNFIPWFGQHPFVLFMVYFVILDFASWVMHRLQHKLDWWWALHSLHHSQRQMSRWSDDRGNIIDSVLQSLFIGAWGIFIGVPPVEYAVILFLGKMVENLSHANTRIRFGPILDKVFVDPRFHRQHHMVTDHDAPHLIDRNYGFIFPIWDIMAGKALYDGVLRPTGVDVADVDTDNGKSWLGQQVASTGRMLRVLGIGKPRSVVVPEQLPTASVKELVGTR